MHIDTETAALILSSIAILLLAFNQTLLWIDRYFEKHLDEDEAYLEALMSEAVEQGHDEGGDGETED